MRVDLGLRTERQGTDRGIHKNLGGHVDSRRVHGEAAAEWWNSFHDEELTRLIHRAVANNLDLRLAAARVDEARAARGVAKSAFYPSVGVTTSAERLHERVAAFNPGVNAPTFHPVELNNFQVDSTPLGRSTSSVGSAMR